MSSRPPASRLSELARQLRPSGIREFFDLVVGIEDVISLGVGEPDFPTPWRICDAVIHSLRQGATSYTSNRGLLELRTEIARYLEMRHGLEYDPETQIIVTVGVSEALDLVMRALLDPGDEVLISDPCYVSYGPCVTLAYGQPVFIPTRIEDEFRLRPDAVSAAVSDRTRALLMGYPNNPTGAVMTRAHLQEVTGAAADQGLLVISDEIYAELTYEGEHVSVPALPAMYDRAILLNGFSKAHAMTGWRIGYACGPQDLIEAMTRIHAYVALCAPIVAQTAALEALRNGEADRARMVAEYDQRRRVLVNGLNRIGLTCFEPKGAFYAFPSIAHTGLTSRQFSRALLQDQKVAAVPGSAFGQHGEGYIRCTYASSIADLREALARIERFLSRLEAGEIEVLEC